MIKNNSKKRGIEEITSGVEQVTYYVNSVDDNIKGFQILQKPKYTRN